MFHASYSWSGPQLPKGCGCIGFLSPMHIKDPRFLFEKRRGQPWDFWSLVLTIDDSGSTLTQDCVEEYYSEHKVTGKTYNLNKYIYNDSKCYNISSNDRYIFFSVD